MAKKGNKPWNKGLNNEVRTCVCGCGKKFKVPKHSKKKFVDINHFYKYNKGEHNCSSRQEVKDKIAEKARNREYGPRSKEAIEKQRKKMLDMYASMTPEDRKKHLRVDDPEVKVKVKAKRVEYITKTCKYCTKEFEVRINDVAPREFCCEECRIDYMKDTGGYCVGIPKSEETKEKISKSKRREIEALSEEEYYKRFATRIGSLQTEETKKKISESLEKSREARSLKNKIRWDSVSLETKRAIISNLNKALAKNRFYYDSSIAGRVFLHSSYEKRLSIVFDNIKVNWQRNEEAFPYFYKGRIHYYTPDFFVDKKRGIRIYYETKGYFREKDLYKIEGFRKLGNTLIVVDGKALKRYEKICKSNSKK